MIHVVYCDDKSKELSKILNGEKTMVIRGSVSRKVPHSRVFNDDILYFIERNSNRITAKAIVTNVQNYSKLSLDEIANILDENASKLCLSDKQKEKVQKSCLCLVEFDHVESIEPLDFKSKRIMDDWLILDDLDSLIVK